MKQGSAPSELVIGRAGPAANARRTALRGSSAIAICRALLCRALPGIVVGTGVYVMPESAVSALSSAEVHSALTVIAGGANVASTKLSPLPHRFMPAENRSMPSSHALTSLRVRHAIIRVDLNDRAAKIAPVFPRAALPPHGDDEPHTVRGLDKARHGALVLRRESDDSRGLRQSVGELIAHAELEFAARTSVPDQIGASHSESIAETDANLIAPRIEYRPVSLEPGISDALLPWAPDVGPTQDSAAIVSAQLEAPQILPSAPKEIGAQVPPSLYAEQPITLPVAWNGGAIDPVQSAPIGATLNPDSSTNVARHLVIAARSFADRVGRAAVNYQGNAVAIGLGAREHIQSAGAPVRLLASIYEERRESGTAELVSSAVRSALSTRIGTAGSQHVAGAKAAARAFEVPRLVQLRLLLEALSDHFQQQELKWLISSTAANSYLPIARLESAGITVAETPIRERLMLNMAAMQAAPTRGGAGAEDGISTGGFGGLGLKQSLSASASAGFDSNPFLAEAGSPEVASLRLQLVPALTRTGERSTFRLSGRLEHIEYLGNYDSLQNYGADLTASRKVTERIKLDGGFTFRSDVLATNLNDPLGNPDPGTDIPVPPTGNDVTILGQGQRRTSYGLDGGATFTLSERDQLRWSINARADRFGATELVDSNFLAQRLQYSRRFGEDFTVGAAIYANLIDFSGAGLDGAQTLSPQLQVTAGLTPRLTLSGSVGIAVTRLEFGGLEETTTAVAGDFSLCRKGDRSSLCVNGSRQVLPAAIGGALLQTTGGISYSLKLSERDTVQVSGSYGTASQPLNTTLGDFESINGSARYERQLGERLRLFVSGGVLNTSGNLPTDVTNIQGLIGITFDLGQKR